MKLRSKIFIPMASLVVLMLAILEAYVLPQLHITTEEDFTEQQTQLITMLGTTLVPLLITNDLAAIHSLLDEQHNLHPEWKTLNLVNAQNIRLYPLVVPENIDDLYGHRINFGIVNNGEHLGQIDVLAGSEKMHEKEQKLINIIYLMLVIFMFVTIIIAGLLNRIIGKPINQLKHSAEKIAHGDFEAELPLHSDDEIGELTDNFIYMKENIAAYQRDIENKAVYIETILKGVHNAIISASSQGVIQSFNQAAEKIFGHTSDEVIGKNLTILMPMDYAQAHDGYLKKYLKTGETTVIGEGREITCKRKDGSTFDANLAVNETKIDNEIIFTGVIRDITEQKAAEKTLAIQQMLVSTINQAQSFYITSGDPVVFFSAILPDIIQLTGSEYGLIGESLFDEKGQQYLKAYAATNIAWDDETNAFYEQYKDQGMEFHNLDNLFGHVITDNETILTNEPQTDPRSSGIPKGHPPLNSFLGIPLKMGNNIVGMVGIANRDGGYDKSIIEMLQPILNTCGQLIDAMIKERKRQQQEVELRKAKQEAEAAARAKSNFLATMSHEIRTPMNGVLGMLQLLKKTSLGNDQQRFLDTASGSGEMLLTVINDILDFSKMDADSLELESIPFSPIDVVEETTILLAQLAHDKGLELYCQIEPTVPKLVKGDPTRLRQIFTNLVNNAIKFTSSGGYVSLHCSYDGERLRFAVVDTGIGITTEQQKLLFKPFTQVDSSHTRKFGGTGLGLVISQRLVQAMGSDLEVLSVPSFGTEFSFELMPEIIEAFTDDEDKSNHLKHLRFLIVDDNLVNRTILEQVLMSWNVKHIGSVESATDGLTEIDKAQQQSIPYDFILLDRQMPNIDGLEMARQLRTNDQFKDIHIVMLSSDDNNNLPEVDAWLKKPVRQSDLFNTIMMVSGQQVYHNEDIARDDQAVSLSFAGRQLLLVEDNDVNQEVASLIFTDAGFDVDIQDNGEKAVRAVQEKDYDVVMMDIQMPVMDGLEAAQTIRLLGDKFKTLPIIAMTAHALTGDSDKSFEAGMNAHVTKPIDGDAVLKVISEWVSPDILKPTILKNMDKDAQSSFDIQNLPGIDVDDGLNRLRGNSEAYKRILKGFLQKQATSADVIASHIEKQEWDDARRLAHTIKGSSANISAVKLSRAASALEQACNQQDKEQIDQLLLTFSTELEFVMNGLKELEQTVTSANQSTAVTTMDDTDVLKGLEELLDLLDQDVGAAQSQLRDMVKSISGHEIEPQFISLMTALDNFDIDTAQAESRVLIEQLKS